MRTIHPSIIIDRYYRGAVVYCRGKLYLLSEETAKIFEKILARENLPSNNKTEVLVKRLEEMGVLIDQQEIK